MFYMVLQGSTRLQIKVQDIYITLFCCFYPCVSEVSVSLLIEVVSLMCVMSVAVFGSLP